MSLMKRLRALICAVLLLLPMGVLSGCNKNTSSNDKLHVVCTIFPQYDWVRQILGDQSKDIALTLLLDNKIDLHSYQPSVADIAQVASCDLFIYVGGESDAWVHDALISATNKNMTVINLLDILGDSVKEEEIKEGMEHEHEHEREYEDEHAHEDEHEHEHEDEHEHEETADVMSEHEHAYESAVDEHVWLSLRNAQLYCTAIAEALSSLDAGHAELYRANLDAYNKKLAALDVEYQAVVRAAQVKTLLFGDRFPFRYLVDDYGLNYYAAFSGCSAETEASFETIIFLAGKVDELGLKYIMVTERSDQSIAATIKNNSTDKNQQVHVLDSMQSVSSEDITKGMTYLSVMENNLYVLKDVLNNTH